MLAMISMMVMAGLAAKVELRDAHVTATGAGGSVAVSAFVVNPNTETVTIVGASSPMAGQTVMQRYVKDSHGMVQLDQLASLPLGPKSETVLAPGALELQLVGLTQDLQAGLELPLVLKFSDGTQRTVRLNVEGE